MGKICSRLFSLQWEFYQCYFSQEQVRATPLYCHTVSHCLLKAELCYCYYLFRGRVQEPTLSLSQPCLWLFSQALHLPCAGRDHATLTLAYHYRTLTPEYPSMTPMHRVRLVFLCFDILGSNIWETDEGFLPSSGERLGRQNGNVVCFLFLREKWRV